MGLLRISKIVATFVVLAIAAVVTESFLGVIVCLFFVGLLWNGIDLVASRLAMTNASRSSDRSPEAIGYAERRRQLRVNRKNDLLGAGYSAVYAAVLLFILLSNLEALDDWETRLYGLLALLALAGVALCMFRVRTACFALKELEYEQEASAGGSEVGSTTP